MLNLSFLLRASARLNSCVLEFYVPSVSQSFPCFHLPLTQQLDAPPHTSACRHSISQTYLVLHESHSTRVYASFSLQSISVLPTDFKNSFVSLNGFDPKNPRYADSGLG